jgi:hypothetical protein
MRLLTLEEIAEIEKQQGDMRQMTRELLNEVFVFYTPESRNMLLSRGINWESFKIFGSLQLYDFKYNYLREIYPKGFVVEHPIPFTLPGPRISLTLKPQRLHKVEISFNIYPTGIGYAFELEIDYIRGRDDLEHIFKQEIKRFETSIITQLLTERFESFANSKR